MFFPLWLRKSDASLFRIELYFKKSYSLNSDVCLISSLFNISCSFNTVNKESPGSTTMISNKPPRNTQRMFEFIFQLFGVPEVTAHYRSWEFLYVFTELPVCTGLQEELEDYNHIYILDLFYFRCRG